jgi:hypothetical protein
MSTPEIPAEAFEAAAQAIAKYDWNHMLSANGFPGEHQRNEARVAVDAALPHLVAAGRTAAAAAIREAPYPDPSPCIPAWHAGYVEAWFRAARIAEGQVAE